MAGADGHWRVLIVEDDELVAQSLARSVGKVAEVEIARTAPQALRLIRSHDRWCALVVDVNLDGMPLLDRPSDQKGLTVLRAFRQRFPVAPALVMTGLSPEGLSEKACVQGASFLRKGELTGTTLRGFIKYALKTVTRHTQPDAPHRAELNPATAHTLAAGLHTRPELTDREVDLLATYLVHRDRDTCAAELNISIKTYDRHVQAILAKTGVDSMVALAMDIFASAIPGFEDS